MTASAMRAITENISYEQSAIRSLHGVSREFAFLWHYHDEIEISWIMKGNGIRYTGDRVDHFSAPELIFVPARLPHTWQSEKGGGDKECIVLQFRPDFLGRETGQKDTAQLASFLCAAQARKFHLTDGLIRSVVAVHESTGAMRLARFLLLLEELNRTPFTPANDSSPELLDEQGSAALRTISRYISEHWHTGISVPGLAAVCGMSESTFRRFFKRATHQSFVDHLNALRVSRACELLISDRHGIAEICYLSGFGNTAFFNRKFRALKGMTPREFRNFHRRGVTPPSN
jgi:AraC-like DNA-binding protein